MSDHPRIQDDGDGATPPVRAPRRGLRRALWGLAALAGVFVLLAGMVGGVFWAAGTTGGSSWLLARLALVGVHVQVDGLDGTLIGDLKARRVTVVVGGTRVVVEEPQWRSLSVRYTHEPATWARIHVASLSARNVIVTTTPGTGGKPFTLPTRLHLPVELAIDDVQTAELHVPGLQDHPFRDVRGQVQLGHDRGREHRFDKLSGRLDPLLITGHARIGAVAPLALDVQLQATQSPQGQAALPTLPAWAKSLRTDWQARLSATGPLAKFDLQAQLRAQGQSLDASAQVAPVARWPLPQLAARTQGLDLSALLQKAPLTALDGTVHIAPDSSAGPNTVSAVVELANTRPGRWDRQQLPVRQLALTARWRTDQADELTLPRFDATLADEHRPAGTVQGTARWKAGEFAVDGTLAKVQPSALDARLAAMTLSGPVTLSGKLAPRTATGAAAPPRFTALAELSGQLVDPPRPVQLRLDATGSEERVELRELRAVAGGARAELTGTADRDGAQWRVKAKAALVEFDPRPWFPAGPRGGWQGGDHRLNLHGDASLDVLDSVHAAASGDKRVLVERLAGLLGEARLRLDNSVIASVPVTGDVGWQHTAVAQPMLAKAMLDIDGNRLSLDGRITPDARGRQDHWSLEARAPALARVAPLLRVLVPPGATAQMVNTLSGSLTADAQASGRWPEIDTQGTATLSGVRAGDWAVGQGRASWQLGSDPDAPLDVQADIGQASYAQKQIGDSHLQLKGSARDHQLTLRSELKAAPPIWMESLQGGTRQPPATVAAAASAASAPAQATTTATAERTPLRTLVSASAHGSLTGNPLLRDDPKGSTSPWSWKGMLQQFEMRTTQAGATPLLVTRDIALELRGGPPMHATVSAGRADILGAGLKWNRIDWEADHGVVTQQLDMQAELEPLAVAPLLRRVQPNFGWGGDLQVGGKVVIKQTDAFSADIVFERIAGDLTVTEESGTQALGLTDLRVGLDAHDGVWNFTAGLAGHQLGVLGGALVVRTSPQAAWPAADAPVQGVLEAQVANLGTWGPWVPAGWRLDGRLNISATLGGRFNAREYTGKMVGSGIGVRNMVEGINVTDGQVDISLQGDTARINTFSARGGNGLLRVEGDARLDDTWHSRLKVMADKFQLLGRVDLRVVASGEANVAIDGDMVKSDGRFTVDEGLIDFTRLSSPSLSDDVIVTGRSNDPRDATAGTPAPSGNRIALDLLVNLGDNLRMRGLGIDTKLHGELHVSRPGGKWALAGTVNAVDGTFANYGQKLVIDRGVIVFNGAPSDMRLDIQATRPNLDVRVGVAVTGPLQNLRVKLFSEPDMTNNEKLSWLLLGRASDGLGKTDTALVQRAAFALLAGEGDGGPGAITKAFGIDDVGLRQNDSGDSRETVVSVGKQLSKRVYVAYEQNLATSTGSFQVTYRIAQRFVMRLQSGLDRSIDLIGTWRWE
ncbi:MAG: translocation/assembly module TamB domain-containing protein [Rhizobacter sp.]|nr:translocation/assembly module TamB domain-containing protein [Rhizobacter sp.]